MESYGPVLVHSTMHPPCKFKYRGWMLLDANTYVVFSSSMSNMSIFFIFSLGETSHNHHHLLHLLRLKIVCGSYNILSILKGWNPIGLPRFKDMHKNHDPLPSPACNVRLTTVNIGELHAKIFEDSSEVVGWVFEIHNLANDSTKFDNNTLV
jgi:hypothetical protein